MNDAEFKWEDVARECQRLSVILDRQRSELEHFTEEHWLPFAQTAYTFFRHFWEFHCDCEWDSSLVVPPSSPSRIGDIESVYAADVSDSPTDSEIPNLISNSPSPSPSSPRGVFSGSARGGWLGSISLTESSPFLQSPTGSDEGEEVLSPSPFRARGSCCGGRVWGCVDCRTAGPVPQCNELQELSDGQSGTDNVL
jgi:hypothetical protein